MTAIIAALASRTGLGHGLATLIVWAGAALIASSAVWSAYELIKYRGATEARQKIEEQNHEAGIKGSGARMSYDECDELGGVFDFRTGKCSGAEAGDR